MHVGPSCFNLHVDVEEKGLRRRRHIRTVAADACFHLFRVVCIFRLCVLAALRTKNAFNTMEHIAATQASSLAYPLSAFVAFPFACDKQTKKSECRDASNYW